MAVRLIDCATAVLVRLRRHLTRRTGITTRVRTLVAPTATADGFGSDNNNDNGNASAVAERGIKHAAYACDFSCGGADEKDE